VRDPVSPASSILFACLQGCRTGPDHVLAGFPRVLYPFDGVPDGVSDFEGGNFVRMLQLPWALGAVRPMTSLSPLLPLDVLQA